MENKNDHMELLQSAIKNQETIKKEKMDWVMTRYEDTNNRYIEAEQFIIELSNMSWYKRLFLNRKILKFLQSRNKFNF